MHPRFRLDPLEPRHAPARAGLLDPAFGAGGAFDPGTGASLAAVAVTPDGSVVAAGRTAGPTGDDFLVVRLTPAGAPDPNFGTNGRVTVDFADLTGGGGDRATSVAVAADGSVTVAGSGGNGTAYLLLARLGSTGVPDAGFGTGGRAVLAFAPADLGPSQFASGMAIDAQNRVLVAATTYSGISYNAEVDRFTAAGQLDPAFDGDGRRPIPGGGTNSYTANAVAVQADGTVVAVGTSKVVAPGRFQGLVGGWAMRLADDGTVAPGATIAPALTRPNALAPVPAGGVVIAGDVALQISGINPPGAADFGLARRAADGTIPADFAASGSVVLDLGAGDSPAAVAVAADGRVVVAGSSTGDFPVVRFNADGTTDAAFNSALDATALGGGFSATAVAFQGNDVIVAGNGRLVRLAGTTTLDLPAALAAGGPADGTARVSAAGGTFATVQPFAAGASARVATGDVDGDGTPDLIAVTGPGVPLRVTVVSGSDGHGVLVAPFDPFGDPAFTGGGFVAAADIDRDGKAEFVVTPDEGGGPRVTVYSVVFNIGRSEEALGPVSLTVRANFFGIDDPNFRGGARAALGDVNGDGTPDLAVAAGFGGGPRVALFAGGSLFGTPTRLIGDFFAFPGTDATTLRNGAFVAAGDVTGDGLADLVFGGGPGGGPRVFVLDGARVSAGDVVGAQAAPVANFFVAGDAAGRGGARVAVTDADGDERADVAVGSGAGQPGRVRVYPGKAIGGDGEPAGFTDRDPFAGAAVADGVYVG